VRLVIRRFLAQAIGFFALAEARLARMIEAQLVPLPGQAIHGPELVDRIYECSVVPELWPGILDEIKRIAGGRGGTLWITKADVQFWSAAPASREGAAIFAKEGWFWRGQVVARLFAARHAGFLTDLDLFTRNELDQEPIYRDMWSKYGVSWSVATAIWRAARCARSRFATRARKR
jgi:hypothetical protein